MEAILAKPWREFDFLVPAKRLKSREHYNLTVIMRCLNENNTKLQPKADSIGSPPQLNAYENATFECQRNTWKFTNGSNPCKTLTRMWLLNASETLEKQRTFQPRRNNVDFLMQTLQNLSEKAHSIGNPFWNACQNATCECQRNIWKKAMEATLAKPERECDLWMQAKRLQSREHYSLTIIIMWFLNKTITKPQREGPFYRQP